MNQVQGMHTDVATMRHNSIWREASRIVYEEGFMAFWKGNLVTIAHRLPYSSISFYAYERYKHVRAHQNLYSILFYFILFSSLKIKPHTDSRLTDELTPHNEIIKSTQLKSNQKMLSFSLFCKGCFISYWFGTDVLFIFNLVQLLQTVPGLDRHREFVAADVGVRLIGGGLAGITAASLTYPLDLVRTRLAAQVSSSHHLIFSSHFNLWMKIVICRNRTMPYSIL